jgi:hypothetical protein
MTKKKSFQTLTPVESLVPAVASSPPSRPHCEPPWPAVNLAELMSFISGLEAKKTRGFTLASLFSIDYFSCNWALNMRLYATLLRD